MANLKRVKSALCLWNVLSGLVQASTEPSASQTCGLISLLSVDFHSLSTRATGFNCDAFSLHLKWSRVFHDCQGVAKLNNDICSAFVVLLLLPDAHQGHCPQLQRLCRLGWPHQTTPRVRRCVVTCCDKVVVVEAGLCNRYTVHTTYRPTPLSSAPSVAGTSEATEATMLDPASLEFPGHFLSFRGHTLPLMDDSGSGPQILYDTLKVCSLIFLGAGIHGV